VKQALQNFSFNPHWITPDAGGVDDLSETGAQRDAGDTQIGVVQGVEELGLELR